MGRRLATLPAVDVVALIQLSDCEAVGGGWLKQPVNAWSSLAFAGVGVALASTVGIVEGRERVTRLGFAALLVATGIGSFLFHGPHPSGAQYFHDASFLAVLWFLIAANLTGAFAVGNRATVIVTLAGIVAIGAALAIADGLTNALAAVLVVALVASDGTMWQRARPDPRWFGLAVAALIVGVGLFVVGRTGSALCEPGSLLQGHGGWHVFAAVFLSAYFLATAPARTGIVSR